MVDKANELCKNQTTNFTGECKKIIDQVICG
jgi:hypothetical protein